MIHTNKIIVQVGLIHAHPNKYLACLNNRVQCTHVRTYIEHYRKKVKKKRKRKGH